jgi:hypothetical protein
MQIESLFIFLLIVSGNCLAELFPCRFQKDLTDTIGLKHFVGFLTLLFFVVLQSPSESFNLFHAFKNATILYILFLLLVSSHHYTFITAMVLLTISYLITLKIKENDAIYNHKKSKVRLQASSDNMKQIQLYLHYIIVIVIVFGFLSYLGSKKSEYKKNFNYFTFIFGKTVCANDGSKLAYIKGLVNAFS